MVKLYASLLSLTLTTSLALAAPHPSYYDRDLLERDLDEEFSRREYLFDASDDLAAREPSFFGGIKNAFKAVGRVANKGLHVAENVAENPLVQTAASFIPGGAVAEKVLGTIGKVEKFEKLAKKANAARQTVHKLEHLGGGLKKGKKIEKAIKKEKQADRKVGKIKHLGSALGKVKKFDKAIKHAKQVHKVASAHSSAHHTAQRRHHRRDLEDNEELSRRDLDAEELFEREYDDFLAERDFFDDLD